MPRFGNKASPWSNAPYSYLTTRQPVFVEYASMPSFPSLLHIDPQDVTAYISADINDARLPQRNALLVERPNESGYSQEVRLVEFTNDAIGMVANESEFLRSKLHKAIRSEGRP